MGDWEGVRLHVVTGKGGTGKTTVASALAIALATGGQKVLLVEVEERQGLAQLFDVAPLEYAEHRIVPAAGGGEVYGLAVDAREAMYEYLAMFYRLGRAGRALDRVGFVDFATTIAPGLRDVLLTGKTYEAVRRRDENGEYVYDAVVLDAPPTGRITRFLDVNTAVSSLARVGPIHRQASSITSLVHSPRTVVHVATVLEEMPVQETADAVAELRAAKIPVGAVVINQTRTSYLSAEDRAAASAGQLDRSAIAASLRAASLPENDAFVDQLCRDAAGHADRIELENEARASLNALDRPVYELPHLTGTIDPTALYELAEMLNGQGAS